MQIFGLAGWSGSGKTTLLTAIIPELAARGLTVSTIKHAHHEFDIDRPGKDSWRHRQAGAREVMVASSRRWALMHELRDAPGAEPRRAGGADDPGGSAARRGLQASPAPEDRSASAERSASSCSIPTTRGSSRSPPTSRSPRRCRCCRSAIRRRSRRSSRIISGLDVMAQLSDDCFAFGGALLGVDAALALIEERVTPVVEAETVPLAAAAGRILARDLVAGIDVPPHANSAVDGFAIAHADLLPGSRDRTAGDRPRRRRPSARPADGAAARRSASSPARRCRTAPTR